ncbi:MAG: GDYXXLXY domain-containing protein [Candidatus Peregrinibacteria bacterium]|nr:GDYXXLXY domain-containing protein [Candidatus Peregrinibacteria bacterium]
MNRRTLFLIGLLLELAMVFGLFLPYVLHMRNGTVITLRTEPIDPMSIFRGQYVVLGYQAGADLPAKWEGGQTVYAVLEKKGDTFERVRFSEEFPTLGPGEVCIRGQGQYRRLIFPDIAQYFVEEGLGQELEQVRNARRLLVDVVVNPSCKAVIRGVRLGPEVPASELPEWMRPPTVEPLEKPTAKPVPAR